MEQKQKLGRPKKPKGEKFDDQVRIKTTTTLKQVWAEKAQKAGFDNLSEWFRTLADES